jgi:hypothetical protein
MPVRTVIDKEKDIIEHIATGDVVDDEMFEAQREFYENSPTRLQIWDMTEGNVTGVTIGGMRTFVERDSRKGQARKDGNTAVVASTQLQFGLARMAEAFGEFVSLPFAFRVFKDRAEAFTWLNEE